MADPPFAKVLNFESSLAKGGSVHPQTNFEFVVSLKEMKPLSDWFLL